MGRVAKNFSRLVRLFSRLKLVLKLNTYWILKGNPYDFFQKKSHSVNCSYFSDTELNYLYFDNLRKWVAEDICADIRSQAYAKHCQPMNDYSENIDHKEFVIPCT